MQIGIFQIIKLKQKSLNLGRSSCEYYKFCYMCLFCIVNSIVYMPCMTDAKQTHPRFCLHILRLEVLIVVSNKPMYVWSYIHVNVVLLEIGDCTSISFQSPGMKILQ
jgi:hypothetical protein